MKWVSLYKEIVGMVEFRIIRKKRGVEGWIPKKERKGERGREESSAASAGVWGLCPHEKIKTETKK